MYQKNMLVFAVETSCDETSVCIMSEDKNILSHIIYSQEIHKKHGGVVPELASRAHLEILQHITKEALKESGVKLNDIDVFAATCGPGLIGGLLIGSTFTKSLSIGSNKPFIPINHLEAHVLSAFYNNKIKLPHLSLLVTGGHTQIYKLDNINEIKLIGETIDDAVGEAFDKVAKILGLNYPGGAELERRSLKGNGDKFALPQPLINENNLDFSFSGLKTAINIIAKKNHINEEFVNDMSASFQKCISAILEKKLEKAIEFLSTSKKKFFELSIVGGVANNKYIRTKLTRVCKRNKMNLVLPINEMMSDNAAMIAWACINKLNKSKKNIYFRPNPRLSIKYD